MRIQVFWGEDGNDWLRTTIAARLCKFLMKAWPLLGTWLTALVRRNANGSC